MRIPPPSSHARFKIRLLPLDAIVAVFAPVFALYLRNALSIGDHRRVAAYTFCMLSAVFSLVSFIGFKIHESIPRYLSLRDLITIGNAILAAELLTCVVMFTFTRLEGIPRSVPAIHALILGAGLLGIRTAVRLVDENRSRFSWRFSVEHTVIVGVNDLSVLFMKYVEAAGAGRRRVIALLDDNPNWLGRSINGVRVYGPPGHLEALMSEFATHGVKIDRVLIGVEGSAVSEPTLEELRRICGERGLEFVPLPQAFQPEAVPFATALPARSETGFVPYYFTLKRLIDVVVAGLLLVAFLPLWLLVAAVAFLDVGTPVWFWQRRLGRWGRPFQLYKVRTLRPAFDGGGRHIDESRRLSPMGRLLRQTRLDEWPQLINILAGDMSLIGPRPLLPRDQPADPAARLMVRPGITGWAQVNGGALLSPAEKQALDSWYIENASVWLDLRIIPLTFLSLVCGDRRSAAITALARVNGDQTSFGKQRNGVRVSSRFRPPHRAATPIEDRRRNAVN